MLSCPYCDYTCGIRQQLALHLRQKHKTEWQGAIATSLPEGFNVGIADVKMLADYESRRLGAIDLKHQKAMVERRRAYQREYYARMTPEQRQAKMSRDKLRVRELKTATKPVTKSECPYCEYGSWRTDSLQRHIKIMHPGKTGLISLSQERQKQLNGLLPTASMDLKQAIIETVAKMILAEIKGTQ